MTIQDLINGAYEMLCGFAILLHVRTLYKDKKVHGVNWIATSFMASWGIWNLYYYPHLGQWMSFYGGLFIVVANAIWLGMMIYYLKFYPKKIKQDYSID